MSIVQALLLYICAVGGAEALLAAHPVAANAAVAPRAVLSSYQIVLPFPGSGGALFTPAAAAPGVIHPFTSEATLHQPFATFPAPTALVDVENLLERDPRLPTTYAATPAPSPADRTHHAFFGRSFSHQQEGSDRADYADLPYTGGVPQRNSVPDSRSGPFGSPGAPRVAQTNAPASSYASLHSANGLLPDNRVDTRFSSPSSNGLTTGGHRSSPADSAFSSPQTANVLVNRRFRPSQHSSPEFVSQPLQRTPHQPSPALSDRHYQPSRQSLNDFGIAQQNQQVADPSAALQYQPFHADDRYTQRPQTSGRFNSFAFAYSFPNEEDKLVLPQNQIQQRGYNPISNDYAIEDGSYRQINAPFNYETTSYSRLSPEASPRLSFASSPTSEDQIYQVDVEGNGYGYRYAVQSSHNHNMETSRRQENINPATSPSHNLN